MSWGLYSMTWVYTVEDDVTGIICQALDDGDDRRAAGAAAAAAEIRQAERHRQGQKPARDTQLCFFVWPIHSYFVSASTDVFRLRL